MAGATLQGGALHEFHVGSRFVALRGVDARGRAVVVKTPRVDRPASGATALLRREYEILRELEVPGVVRPLAFEEIDGRPALVLEDAGSTDLTGWLVRRRERLTAFFDVAIQVADTLARVHDRGVIHRDVNPSNIVLQPDGRATLVDFEIATRLPSRAAALAPTELEGTLAYVSPEQTGRVSRMIDHRSDLYSLGATFYEALTGAPPFASADPLEVVHGHLARFPVRPSAANPAIPEILSDIVLKLLAKMPEQRYQSAAALAADLREARRRWLETGAIAPFGLATVDLARQLRFPDALYGRERELRLVCGALDRVAAGASEVVLVVGPGGVGKTALVEALQPAVAERGGHFASGKVDLRRGNVPYAPIVEAFRGLARALLQEREQLEAWRHRIVGAVRPNGRVLTELVPELEALLGPQPAVPPLGGVESENRLHLTCRAFVRVVATPERPLALFFDDLQWADASSLKLLRTLATGEDGGGALLVAAWRPEEEDEKRPIHPIGAEVERSGRPVTRVEVGPLGADAMLAWLADVLHADPERTRPLAELVRRKTAGYPFFARELLRSLQRNGLLVFDAARHTWTWDLARIERVGVTENVVEHMIAAIRQLPAPQAEMLEVAACVGSRVPLELLAGTAGRSLEDTASCLGEAIRRELLVPDLEAPPEAGPVYRFGHDRVQQAAYSLLPEDRRRSIHLHIGRRLLQSTPEAALEQRLFEVVDQLDLGADLVRGYERTQLAELDLRAGRRAKALTAYEPALRYLTHGLELLPADAWDTRYATCLQLHQHAAECACLTGDEPLTDRLVRTALPHARSRIDRAELIGVAVVGSTLSRAYGDAIRWARDGLRLFGVDLPEADDSEAVAAEVAAAADRLQRQPLDELLERDAMRDPDTLAAMRLLQEVAAAVWFEHPELYPFVVARMVNLSLEHGNAPPSAYAYAAFGSVLGSAHGQFTLGHAIGRVGAALGRQQADRSLGCRAVFVFAAVVNPWSAPLRSTVPLFREAFATALEAGELRYGGYAALYLVHALWAMGAPLSQVLAQSESALAFGRTFGHQHVVDTSTAFRQAVRCLQGRTLGRTSFDDADFDEASYLASISDNRTALCFYYTLRLQACVLMGEPDEALRQADLAAEHIEHARIVTHPAEQALYTSFALAMVASRVEPARRGPLLARLAANQRQMALWAEVNPANFLHKHLLIEATATRLAGRPLEAARHCEQAIAAAAREELVHEEALANELLGRALLDAGFAQSGHRALRTALDRYAHWGASAKVRALEGEFHEIQRVGAVAVTPESRPMAELDLLSLVKAAGIIAEQVGLDRLLDTLIRVCVEAAGAERAVLILEENGRPLVRAAGSIGAPASLERTPLDESAATPRAVVEHVRRSMQPLVIDDARTDPRFASDRYVAAHDTKSILALPLMRQGALVGTICFENSLTTHAFTPARVELLRLLSGQVATSLEISLLVERLTTEIQERKQAEAVVRFLADAGSAFTESLDYAATLAQVAHQSVPFLGDWCLIDVVEEDGRIHRVASSHVDSEKHEAMRELELRYSPDWSSPQPAVRVLRSGEPLLLPVVSEDDVRAYSRDERNARLILGLGARSALITPLVARGRTLGAITLGSKTPGRYGPMELGVAQELARRAAVGVDNARLYADAQRAIRIRDEFLAIASHELYTPITSLKLATQAMLAGAFAPSPDSVRRIFSMADRQVEKLTQLIDALLSVSRIHAGRVDLELDSVDLCEVVHEVVERFEDQRARSGSMLTVQAPAPVVGRWDRLRLDQIVTNLLSNAIKFGSGEPIEILVERDANDARLVVRDHGMGISPERLPLVFDRFERAVPLRHYGGLGLGLYIVKGMVDMLGGTVSVESTLGEGSTFTVELPCAGPATGSEPRS